MAAFDSFAAFNSSVPERELPILRELQSLTWGDLVAARSEEARLRIVENYIREVQERLANR